MPAALANAGPVIAARCFGIFVGISEFEDPEYGKRPIPNAAADAADLQNALVSNWDWRPANVVSLHGRVLLGQLREGFSRLYRLLDRDDQPATCLIYFSTHGHLLVTQTPGHQPRTDLILLASDSRVTATDTFTALDGLTRSKFESYINALPAARKVIILDACYSAAMPATPLTTNDIYQPSDAAVLASSRLTSRFDPRARNSEFTEALLAELGQRKSQLSVTALFGDVSSRLRKIAGAPQPILRSDGADILLGIAATTAARQRATTDEIIQSFASETSAALSRTKSLALDTYIDRAQIERLFSDFLIQSEKSAFTLVSAAGNGKSTSMRHLALRCIAEGRPVLWFPEPRSERELDFKQFVLNACPAPADSELAFLRDFSSPLIVFFDGINEWRNQESVPPFFRHLLELAAEYRFRVVVSCRELAWASLGAAFAHETTYSQSKEPRAGGEVSAGLPVFNDEELAVLLAQYPQVQSFASEQLLKHPIFASALLHTVDYLQSVDEKVTLAVILREYVRTRTERAASRLGVPIKQIADRVSAVTAEMLRSGKDALGADAFFKLAGDATGTALIDEALFVSGPGGITTEVELILDYLLARHLPHDPLIDFEAFERQVEAFPRMKGAVLLRLCEMTDTAAINRHLNRLREAGYPSMIMEAIRLLPSLAPYETLFLEVFREAPPYLVADALRPAIKTNLPFCMRVARQLFVQVHYYDWELKRWTNVGYQELHRRITEQLSDDEAQFLFDCVSAAPPSALDILLNQWLCDKSPLEGDVHQANIAGVASIYLRAFGEIHSEYILDLLDVAFQSADWEPPPQLVLSLVESLARSNPAKAAQHALRWAETPRDLPAVLAVVRALPASDPQPLEMLARHLVDHLASNTALANLGRIHTGENLEFVRSCIARPELRPGLFTALCDLHTEFPAETRPLIDSIAYRSDLPNHVARTAIDFYAEHEPVPFTDLGKYADHILSQYASDDDLIYHLFATAAKLVPQSPAALAWCEHWIRYAPTALTMESLGNAIRKGRRFSENDLPWLQRWTSYSNAALYPDWLVESDLPTSVVAELLTSIAIRQGISLREISRTNDRLHSIAADLQARPEFSQFRKPDQEFWRAIVDHRS